MTTHKTSTTETPLTLAALGIVYGDIGTSPLYTLKVAMAGVDSPESGHVLGLLSLLFWLIMLVVTIKYVTLVLRADNRGEGGTLALLELALRGVQGQRRALLVIVGLAGACLFYGDSMITPAISVLSAIEGLHLVSPAFDDLVIPLALLVLAGLFLMQVRGTAAVGRLFGPVMLLWFIALAVLGGWRISQFPQVLAALNPWYALQFVAQAPWQVYVLLGALVLAVTGSEALYADMGHLGRRAVQRAWLWVALPALVLCYFGQGALVLSDPAALQNPFFSLAPEPLLVPMVVLATLATIIASQAVISGAFSVTRQAIQLGYWPRMTIKHTSDSTQGQVYLPRVNLLLFTAVVVLVLVFQGSEKLANAYGFANAGAMLVTAILAFFVLPARVSGIWKPVLISVLVLLLLLDLLLFSSTAFKIHQGGWVPLLVGGVLLALMVTWNTGTRKVRSLLATEQQPLQGFMQALEHYPPVRVPGTAIFMNVVPDAVPASFLHNLKHNKVLHEQTVFLTLASADVPYVALQESFSVTRLTPNSWQLVGHWGFKQEPDVPRFLAQVSMLHPELDLEPMRVSYFLSRQSIIVPASTVFYKALPKRLYALMARNADRSTRFYRIPPNSVVEMGMQLEL